MREFEVRDAVRSGPLRKYLADRRSRVIDELAICLGEARIDIAVVNGKLSGYEIKSESDTLTRLPKQVETYARVFDEITLVVDASHSDASLKIIPESWGVFEVRKGAGNSIVLEEVRKPSAATSQDPLALAQLLWKDEVLEILVRNGVRAPTSKPRAWLWSSLASELSVSQLKKEVRRSLKARIEWRD